VGRLVLLHGFTQTSRSFDPLRAALPAGLEVVAPDLPGHGPDPALPQGPWADAAALARRCGRGTWLGYSMGGRLALHVALAHPEVVERLVLVSTTAGIDGAADRAARRAADEELAGAVEAGGVAAFVERWLAQPLLAGLPAGAAGRQDRLRNTATGLAAALRLLGAGAQEALWGRLGELAVPVAAVAGERDHRYVALARRLAAAAGPGATVTVVPGAGHACHLEDPAAVAAVAAPAPGRAG